MSEADTNETAKQAASRPKCKSCVHFLPTDDKSGLCRRYPPTALMVPAPGAIRGQMTLQVQSQWPPTMNERWCGEHPEFSRWFAMHTMDFSAVDKLDLARAGGTS
jgi:hypothetical protein